MFKKKNARQKVWRNNNVILQSWELRDEGSSLSFEGAQAAGEPTRHRGVTTREGRGGGSGG